ncbi:MULTISPECIES: enolase C-terminal domain-like protein [Nocardiopsis]|uniref:Mandelate racemase/muconate lactonizing protein n=1 Tax=Nocardiopsis dassonvillei (strain ATCC 23218 / DSM 43111 / CIP 107115 / JCM 7437 / KCTC 9190 / NBRC 14626 / NCTC 10488 / NRRL B-5397 / IMRU 509) TaxID=446468 RepID=D7AZ54_NOCDD|nr:enolase C-terminal domain-like protein [Nocardiopsis dassonvillei]ADH70034.1 Mandelate racemase/muconate lactonizing protein [Nocardiopsis dassonvillei subsp. dassonvillei DSM 43111]APC38017.1 mandelate racemase [Nocardiopsis dassonvillei]NKY78461.1 mandelate racemase [Nocardiopsis dassonvillei]VEI90549.1 Starvation-sensing protein rspA [Nocardiopsis dassonvillei]
MRIVSAHVGTIPISSSMRNAYIDFSRMDCTILALVSDVVVDGRPLVGYGFNSNGRYNATAILNERMLPRLREAAPEDLLDENGELSPARAWDVMMRNEKPGGHGERSVAVGVVDMALHDLAAKAAGVPLYRWISDHYGDGDPDGDVFVYAAGGYYAPGKTLEDLQDEMRGFLDAGYEVVKMKIGGADLSEDLRRIEAVIDVLGGDGSRLMVDVNGKFDLRTALEYGRAIDRYGLFWYEEVGDPLDYALNATLSEDYRNPIATGENLFSLQDARNLIRYGGMRPDRDFVQVDPALSYGLTEYRRVLDMLARHGWSSRRCIPHGGHQFSLHIAAALKLGGNESYPGEFQPTGGFADEAVVTRGRVAPGDLPGIGLEGKAKFYEVLRGLHG